MNSNVPSPLLDGLTVLDLLDTEEGQQVAYASLTPALAEAQRLMGDDPARWSWGQLHQIRFTHPLLHRAPAELQTKMRMPTYPRGGSSNTTNNTGYRPSNFDVVAGASFRMVLDVGNWDEAWATNAPGQSGDPRSPFYSNLLENWATEGQFRLVYSRELVEQHKAFTVKLEPKKK